MATADNDAGAPEPRIRLSRHSQTFIPPGVREFTRVFLEREASSGIVLLAAAVVALVWANSPWEESYLDFWMTKLTLDLSIITIEEDVRHAVNDGLMTLFFFVVGLEIKRELTHGELADPKRAILPVAAAVGGMALPAAIYLALNLGGDGENGWGIPMATDIAFAIGVLSLLGTRVPFAAKVFLLTLAVVDDIGAILVIAVFYTEDLAADYLAMAGVILLAMVAMNQRGVRSVALYAAAGILLWVAVLKSGVNPTIAGVVLGLLTPAVSFYERGQFSPLVRRLTDRFDSALERESRNDQESLLDQIGDATAGTQAPLNMLENALQPWTSYIVLPLFALANAGVPISGEGIERAVDSSVTQGIVAGLIFGKAIAIFVFAYVLARLGWGALPEGLTWPQVAGIGMLGGIGFTVSLFIADLAFADADALNNAKLGIVAASVFAGVVAYVFLRFGAGSARSRLAFESG